MSKGRSSDLSRLSRLPSYSPVAQCNKPLRELQQQVLSRILTEFPFHPLAPLLRLFGGTFTVAQVGRFFGKTSDEAKK